MTENGYQHGKKMAWTILIVLTLLNALNYMDRMVLSVAMEGMKADLGLTDAQMGTIQAILFLSVGLLILPAGILIDKWSRKKAVAIMAVVWSAATLATGMASNYTTVLIARFGCGSAEAGFNPGGTAWLSVVFPKKDRAKANGIFGVGMILGCMLGMIVGGVLITKTGDWRTPFFVFGVPGIIFGFVALMLKDVAPTVKQDAVDVGLFSEITHIFKKKSFVFASLSQGLLAVIAMTAQAWSVVLLMRAYDLNEAKAGMVLGLTLIPTMIAPALGGFLADRFQVKMKHGRPFFAGLACLAATAAYAISFWSAGIVPFWLYVVLAALSGATGAMAFPIFQVINMDVFYITERGKAAAMLGLVTFLVFSWWGSIVVGKLSDILGGGAYGVKIALLCLCPFGIFAAVTCFICCKYYPEESAAADAAEAELTDSAKLSTAEAVELGVA
jgi:MFS family permease